MRLTKEKCRNLCLLLLLVTVCSSCTTLLEVLFDYNQCAYPGCTRKARKTSSYCAHHDAGLMHDNIHKSLERMRERNRAANR